MWRILNHPRSVTPTAGRSKHRLQLHRAWAGRGGGKPARRSNVFHVWEGGKINPVHCVTQTLQPLQAGGRRPLCRARPCPCAKFRLLRIPRRSRSGGLGGGLEWSKGASADGTRFTAYFHGLYPWRSGQGSTALAQILWRWSPGIAGEPHAKSSALSRLGERPGQWRVLFKSVCNYRGFKTSLAMMVIESFIFRVQNGRKSR